MAPQFRKLFRAPYGVPNGLQVTEDGLWVVDQITDRVALVQLDEPGDYGVTKLVRDIPTDCSNSSGMAYGGGSLWLAANGAASLWRPARAGDAKAGFGEILQVDPESGQTQQRYPIPCGGGTHGVEYDHFEEDLLWITTLKEQTVSKMRISDWSIQQVIPLPYYRGHGVARVRDGLWVVHTADRTVVKFDVQTGKEIDRFVVPAAEPEPHGLSAYGDNLLYCDATSGWVVEIAF